MNVCKPPTPVDWYAVGRPRVFLAGSIEMGVAEDWQTRLTRKLSDAPGTILNPRRDDWDSSWTQEASFAPFREQVEWELEALDNADLILLYFDPSTKSPISLLELGLHAREAKMVVCCPEGFWRRGNVQIVCERYGIPFVSGTDALVARARDPEGLKS